MATTELEWPSAGIAILSMLVGESGGDYLRGERLGADVKILEPVSGIANLLIVLHRGLVGLEIDFHFPTFLADCWQLVMRVRTTVTTIFPVRESENPIDDIPKSSYLS